LPRGFLIRTRPPRYLSGAEYWVNANEGLEATTLILGCFPRVVVAQFDEHLCTFQTRKECTLLTRRRSWREMCSHWTFHHKILVFGRDSRQDKGRYGVFVSRVGFQALYNDKAPELAGKLSLAQQQKFHTLKARALASHKRQFHSRQQLTTSGSKCIFEVEGTCFTH
jgi:hypothetical protein